MTITDEMLFAAADEAAERYLDTLPGREACAHTFSLPFQEKMRPLLRRRHRRWGGLLLAAAVIALAAAITAGADQQSDASVYWRQTDTGVRYAIRLSGESSLDFRAAELGYVPEGYTLASKSSYTTVRGQSRTVTYTQEAGDGRFTVTQEEKNQYSGEAVGSYQAKDLEISGHSAVQIWSEADAWCLLLWSDGPYLFTVDGGNIPAETLLDIAEQLTW